MELLKVDSVERARQKLLDCVENWWKDRFALPLEQSLGGILAEDILAGEDIPAFRRSTVDGYAVMAADTAAAGESLPVFLKLAGEVEMGKAAGLAIAGGECAYVPTGGMLPAGADAVVMVEYSEPFGTDGIALYQPAAWGEHVVQIGDDARMGNLLMERGRRVRAPEIGALAAAGVTRVPIHRPLCLTILSTGDELVAPDRPLQPGQVRDINTYTLQALAQRGGFSVVRSRVVADEEALLERCIREAMADSDIVAVSGGSSQGHKDATRAVIDRIAEPGVFTHGLAVKPGKPTILGSDEATRTLLVGLPGHPVSAMMVFELLLCWLARKRDGSPPPLRVPATLSCNVASSPGKTTCLPVRLTWRETQYAAEPVFGESGLITTLTRADGYFEIDRNREGVAAGECVLVHLF